MSAVSFGTNLSSPSIYPQKLDLARDSVLLIRLEQAEYRAASFLDDRILTAKTEGRWFSYGEVGERTATVNPEHPVHFIFHAGHVGSTLLSRLLDEEPTLLNLREPLPLRSLAELHDRLQSEGGEEARRAFADRLSTFARLWARGFAETRSVTVKATSAVGRISVALVDSQPQSKAVYLNVRTESYLATLLAGENSAADLSGFAAERMQRLSRLLGIDLLKDKVGSLGQLAAASWLAERLTQARAKRVLNDRLLEIDFDAMLDHLEPTLVSVARHFDIPAPEVFAARASKSPALARYSKAPQEFAYSAALRAELLQQARKDQANEIRDGLSFLEALAADHKEVESVLAAEQLHPPSEGEAKFA